MRTTNPVTDSSRICDRDPGAPHTTGRVVEDGAARLGDIEHGRLGAGEQRREPRVGTELVDGAPVATEDDRVARIQLGQQHPGRGVRCRAQRHPRLPFPAAREASGRRAAGTVPAVHQPAVGRRQLHPSVPRDAHAVPTEPHQQQRNASGAGDVLDQLVHREAVDETVRDVEPAERDGDVGRRAVDGVHDRVPWSARGVRHSPVPLREAVEPAGQPLGLDQHGPGPHPLATATYTGRGWPVSAGARRCTAANPAAFSASCTCSELSTWWRVDTARATSQPPAPGTSWITSSPYERPSSAQSHSCTVTRRSAPLPVTLGGGPAGRSPRNRSSSGTAASSSPPGRNALAARTSAGPRTRWCARRGSRSSPAWTTSTVVSTLYSSRSSRSTVWCGP